MRHGDDNDDHDDDDDDGDVVEENNADRKKVKSSSEQLTLNFTFLYSQNGKVITFFPGLIPFNSFPSLYSFVYVILLYVAA